MAGSWNGVRIKKPKVVNRLPEFIAERERRVATAITKALIVGGSEASVLTPIDTGTLINSQFRHVYKEGTSIFGTVGYTAAYALPVHDPSNPQKFRRSTAEKSFLSKGFENAKPAIDALIMGALKA